MFLMYQELHAFQVTDYFKLTNSSPERTFSLKNSLLSHKSYQQIVLHQSINKFTMYNQL